MPGRSDDVGSLLAAADMALLTSTWEARALVAQALLAGVPLVSTRVGGIEELVDSAAMLVPLGDVEEAARQIVALADSPDERRRLGTRASVRLLPGPMKMMSSLIWSERTQTSLEIDAIRAFGTSPAGSPHSAPDVSWRPVGYRGTLTKHLFVTGGVASSLGKGLTASSLGNLLVARGLRVSMQKLDPTSMSIPAR